MMNKKQLIIAWAMVILSGCAVMQEHSKKRHRSEDKWVPHNIQYSTSAIHKLQHKESLVQDSSYGEELGITEDEYKKLSIFSKKAKEVKSKMEEGFISSKQVSAIMGKPDFINKTADIRIVGQKETWQYQHPCYASVRYILVFNKNDDLIMFTAVQLRNPANVSVYYDVDYFLEEECIKNN